MQRNPWKMLSQASAAVWIALNELDGLETARSMKTFGMTTDAGKQIEDAQLHGHTALGLPIAAFISSALARIFARALAWP